MNLQVTIISYLVSDSIYVIGGAGSRAVTAFSLTTNEVNSKAPLRSPRGWAAVASSPTSGEIILCGGGTGRWSSHLDTVEVYNTRTDRY